MDVAVNTDPRERIAQAALANVLNVLPEMFGGERDGDLWHVRQASGGLGANWEINLATGAWIEYALDRAHPVKSGADLVTLYARFHKSTMQLARERIAQRLGLNDRGIEVLPERAADIKPLRRRVRLAQGVADLNLHCDAHGVPYPTVANASAIFERHERFRGKIWYDSFRERVYHTLAGAARPWTDIDTMQALVFVQEELRLAKFNSWHIHDAVTHTAHAHAQNSVCMWLESLTWDGIPRLERWVQDCLGVIDLSDYTMAVSKNWLISMVARAYAPGCQADHMPVLEGEQGRGKSSALGILGGEWYAAIGVAFGDKEFLQNTQGKWLIEIPDMSGFNRRGHSQIIAAITTRSDYYRKSYGRYAEDHPRKCVFAATSEYDDYLGDPRGRRRYWPLRCGEIDLHTLRAMREQLFAEAAHEYARGAAWHVVPADRANSEQLAREPVDTWTDLVLDYVGDTKLPARLLTSAHILERALKLLPVEMTDSAKIRLHRIMSSAGYMQRRDNHSRYWIKSQGLSRALGLTVGPTSRVGAHEEPPALAP